MDFGYLPDPDIEALESILLTDPSKNLFQQREPWTAHVALITSVVLTQTCNREPHLRTPTEWRAGNMSRVTEAEVAEAVENILHNGATGHASIQELIREIPNQIALSTEDLKPSPTRRNEAIWEQQVRNITSHKDSPGNAIFEGKLVAIPGGLALPTKLSSL